MPSNSQQMLFEEPQSPPGLMKSIESPSKRPKPGAFVQPATEHHPHPQQHLLEKDNVPNSFIINTKTNRPGDDDQPQEIMKSTGMMASSSKALDQQAALVEDVGGVSKSAIPENDENDQKGKRDAAEALVTPAAAGGGGGGGEPETVVSQGHLTRVRVGMTLRHWTITSRIGAGSFGETFVALDKGDGGDNAKFERGLSDGDNENNQGGGGGVAAASSPTKPRPSEVCIKVEQESKNVLRVEVLALKRVQACPQVVRYVASGRFMDANYLVMERLGPNLVDVRRMCPRGVFMIHTTLRVGISCLKAIQGVHELGLVHRDIKPSNFVIGLKGDSVRTCYLIDFGLARRYRRSNGEVRPARDETGFRGTSRYASLQSHRHQDLGRVDDLWSLLFMLIEFATGTLPWRKYKDKDDIGRCKEMCIGPSLVKHMPREFGPFLEHLESCSYATEPDYNFLLSLLYRSLERRGYPPNKPLEWEEFLPADGGTVGGEAAQEDSAPKADGGHPPLPAPVVVSSSRPVVPPPATTSAVAAVVSQPQSISPPPVTQGSNKRMENDTTPIPPHQKALPSPLPSMQQHDIIAVEEDRPAPKLQPLLDDVKEREGGKTATSSPLRPSQVSHVKPLMAPPKSPDNNNNNVSAGATFSTANNSHPPQQQEQALPVSSSSPLRSSAAVQQPAHRRSEEQVVAAPCRPEAGDEEDPSLQAARRTVQLEQVEMRLGKNGKSPDSSNVIGMSPAPAADNPLSARKQHAQQQDCTADREGGGSSTNSTSKSAFSPRCHTQNGAQLPVGGGGGAPLVEEENDAFHILSGRGAAAGSRNSARVPPTMLRASTRVSNSISSLHQPLEEEGEGHDRDGVRRRGGDDEANFDEMLEMDAIAPLPRPTPSVEGGAKQTGKGSRAGGNKKEEETTMCSCVLM